MAHPILFWVTIVFLLLVVSVWYLYRKHLVINRSEYLHFISFTEWKSGRDILREIEAKYGGWLSYGEFYVNMGYLEEDGLIEHSDTPEMIDGVMLRRREFIRKPGGRRAPREKVGSPDFHPSFLPA